MIAGATGDGRIDDYQISWFETRYLLPNVCHDRTTLLTNAKGETHDLIPDPSSRVIVDIGSADACSDDPEQCVCRMLQRRVGLFHDFNFSNSCKCQGFH